MKSIKANTKIPSKAVSLTDIEAKIFGITGSQEADNRENAYVALKYFDEAHQCLSEWSKEELREFSRFIKKINSMTWNQIYKTSGRIGNKTGLGYSIHKDAAKLPNKALRDRISPDITFFELRVTGEARAHGFRSKNTFFLIWLDRNHDIYPM